MMRATKMTKNKENRLRRGARGKEKEYRRVLVPKVLVGTVEGLIFSVIAPSGAWRSWRPGPFPGPTVQQWNSWFPKHPKAKVKESQEKGYRSEIGVLDSHFGWQGTPLGHIPSDWSPCPNLVPICSLSTSLAVEASERAKELHRREQPVATFMEKAPKAWIRPISISNGFHVLSAHDDDASFPELGSDICTDRPRMPRMPKRLPQQVRKKRFLCPLEKNTQSETDFISKANDMRAQCRAEILATEVSRDAHQVKMLTSDRPILSTSSRHHTPRQPPPGWQLLSLTVDSGASETVIPMTRFVDTKSGRLRPHKE